MANNTGKIQSILPQPSNRSLLEQIALLDLQAQAALKELESIRMEQLRVVLQFHDLEGRAAKQAKHLEGVLKQRQSSLQTVQESLDQVGAGVALIAANLPVVEELTSARRLLAVRMSFDPSLRTTPVPMETDEDASGSPEPLRSRSPSPSRDSDDSDGHDELDEADA
jgi:hypothetical protein